MLGSVRKFLEQAFGPASAEQERKDGEHDLRVATAALLVEMTRADHQQSEDERAATLHVLQTRFALEAGEARALLDTADDEANEAVSLHEFTALLNANLGADGKLRVVEMLWEIAFADGHLDKYEEYLVRKVADLLYVRHSDLIRVKHRVLERSPARPSDPSP